MNALRSRSYLREAQYRRDRAVVAVAESFYKALHAFLKTRSDELVLQMDGGLSIFAEKFWRNKRSRNLVVKFTPSQGMIRGGIGQAGKLDVLVFAIMKGPGDRKSLATRLSRDHVIHEMAHFLDPGRKKGAESAKLFSPDAKGVKAYFNSASEWNAYWQEGLGRVVKMLDQINKTFSDDPGNKKKAIASRFGKDVNQFRKMADKYWDREFFQNMDADENAAINISHMGVYSPHAI